ncbi:DNA replication licensing factor Mcm [Trema orientale]|uniref:DNA helicase n=1 Tax=Trema orientale TaxID=63057 RepID=A0A2P5FDE6_TREOI|nr:DNA replication licensing factor Mcm [Trema orientale]
MDEHDQYESIELDDSLEDERDLDQIMADRKAAESELDARDAQLTTTNRKLPHLLHDQGLPREPGPTSGLPLPTDHPTTMPMECRVHPDEDDEEGKFETYRVQGTLREWVTRDEVRRFIAKKFKEFLLTYVNPKNENSEFKYVCLINEIVSANKCSLEIDYKQYIYIDPNIAIWLADAPQSVLEVIEDVAKNILPQDLLKKYVTYAKLNVFPRLHDADMDKLTHVYAELRKESSHRQGVPIAVRHIESMIRISEPHARMHLRQHVTQEDVDMAIRVLLDSFISTQKFGVQKALQKSFRKYMTYKKDYNELLLYLFRELVKNALHFDDIVSGSTSGLTHIDVKVEDLQIKAQEHEIYDLKPFFTSTHFSRANFVLDEQRGVIRHRLC